MRGVSAFWERSAARVLRRQARLAALTSVALAAALVAFLPAATTAATAAGEDGSKRYLVSGGEVPAGTETLADYGESRLVALSAGQAEALRAVGLQVDALLDANVLKLQRTTIDTTLAVPAVPRGLAAGPAPTSWVVQLVGPAAPGWWEAVREAGAHLVAHGYVPEHGWLVRAPASTIDTIRAFPFVQAAVPFHPAYRISPRLDALTGALEVRVLLFDDASLPAWADKISGLGAVELGRVDETDVKLLRLSADASLVPALARLDAVQWIEPVAELKLHNDRAADTMGIRPVWNGANGLPGLEGEGEIVAVADTGLDNGNPAEIHPDFRGRVKQLQAWGRPGPGGDIYNGDASDPSFDQGTTHGVGGHGTHTAGSVLGDGTAWTTVSLLGCRASCNPLTPPKGTAPKAQLVFQSISGPDFGSLSGVPEDPGDLYGAAYDQGARVHSNSYGSSSAGAYDSQAFMLDRFMETHPDMLITFSAGNSGNDGDLDGRIDPGSIGSPATAKDTLAVGASEDDRAPQFTSGRLTSVQGNALVPLYSTYAVFLNGPVPPIVDDFMSNDEEGMVAFSSRGPTQDGRIKPEVVGVGTHVLSTRTRLIPDADVHRHYWSRPQNGSSVASPGVGDYPLSISPFYAFSGGTSMSNPLVAGTAAVVRQYLRTQRGFAAPSSALLKAALTAGAHEMEGQYGSVAPDVVARPDFNEGWGRVDVASTVAPTGPTRASYYDDPVGIRTGATARYGFEVTDTTVPMRVQLAWTDVPGNLVAAKSLVNDLDLILRAPDGTTYRGNRFLDRGANGETPSQPNAADANRVDNLEGITVPASALAPGTWTVEVRGFTVPRAPQRYALAVRGGLGAVATGAIHLDAAAYRSGGRPITIVVSDPGRNTAGADSVTTTVSTTSAPAGVTVTLAESASAQGVFTGSIALGAAGSAATSSSVPGADGDEIRVTYTDAGGRAAAATARVDNRAPTISGTTVTTTTPFSAGIKFASSEPAAGSVSLGPTPTAYTQTASDPALVFERTVTPLGLDGGKRYYFRVRATDDPGNVGTDDDGERRYTFRTRTSTVEYSYDAESEAGWTHQNNPDNPAATVDEWHLTQRPDAVHGGTSAWLFGPEDPNATHGPNEDAFLDSPEITRRASNWATVAFWANYDTEKGFDGVNVLGSDDGGASYRQLPLVAMGPASPPSLASAQIDGNSGGYRLLTFDISNFTGATFRLRLQWTSDGGVERGGFAFDDLVVTGSAEAPVSATLTAKPDSTVRPQTGFSKFGTLVLGPERDWARVTRLVLRRTGGFTDAEVPEVRLTVPGKAPVVARFSNGIATFDRLAFDSSAAAPAGATVEIRLPNRGKAAKSVGLSVQSASIASPDTLSVTAVFPPISF